MLNRIVLSIPAWGFILAGLVLLLICVAFANRLRFYGKWLPMLVFIVAGIMLFLTFAGMAQPVMIHADETWMESIRHWLPRLFQYTPEPYRWLSDPDTAMVACILPMLWAGMGPGCLIYLAAMKGIPSDYFEAADIDGATFIDKLLFIVFPMLKVLLIINFIGAFIGSWYSSADNILAMTGGGANTETAALHIWFTAFTYLKFGPAAAMAWMLGFILIGFTVHQLRILSKVEFKTAGKQ
jgi:multiple sugar transport system permease protein